MVIDDKFLDELLEKAAMSERRRINFDLRTSAADSSQRMLNALLPDTCVPIHRHPATSETVVILRGMVEEVFYDENGAACYRCTLSRSLGNYVVQIPAGQWHTIIAKEPSVILEAKDGAFEPLSPENTLTGGGKIQV